MYKNIVGLDVFMPDQRKHCPFTPHPVECEFSPNSQLVQKVYCGSQAPKPCLEILRCTQLSQIFVEVHVCKWREQDGKIIGIRVTPYHANEVSVFVFSDTSQDGNLLSERICHVLCSVVGKNMYSRYKLLREVAFASRFEDVPDRPKTPDPSSLISSDCSSVFQK
jgi:hypothetical protein